MLAESVFDGVRAKMSHLRAQLTDREASLVALQQELQSTRQRHAEQLAQLAQAHEQELAASASDAAAAVSRHLAFIDRLMADKEQLGQQLAAQQAAAKVRGNSCSTLTWLGSPAVTDRPSVVWLSTPCSSIRCSVHMHALSTTAAAAAAAISGCRGASCSSHRRPQVWLGSRAEAAAGGLGVWRCIEARGMAGSQDGRDQGADCQGALQCSSVMLAAVCCTRQFGDEQRRRLSCW